MRRSQRQIIRSMLENSREGIKKTNLMFAARVSWKQLKPYIELLINLELLEQKGLYYLTTDKGLSWLLAFQGLRQLEEPLST